VLVLPLSPLRERKEDIPLLAKHFLNALAVQRNVKPKTLSQDALAKLLAHAFPGNVRELQHAMEYGMAMANSDQIEPGDLPPNINPSGIANAPSSLCLETTEKIDMRDEV